MAEPYKLAAEGSAGCAEYSACRIERVTTDFEASVARQRVPQLRRNSPRALLDLSGPTLKFPRL